MKILYFFYFSNPLKDKMRKLFINYYIDYYINNSVMSQKQPDSNKKILEMVNKLLTKCKEERMVNLSKINKPQYIRELRSTYEDFAISYPGLFNLIMDDPFNFDIQRLHYMLDMRKSIGGGNITYEAASARIGQEYYDEFVKPIVDEKDNQKKN